MKSYQAVGISIVIQTRTEEEGKMGLKLCGQGFERGKILFKGSWCLGFGTPNAIV